MTAQDQHQYQPSERTALRRLPERGAYDHATVHAILDEGFICHVGFAVDGQPYVVPTGYARVGETLYLHGSSGSRLGLLSQHPMDGIASPASMLGRLPGLHVCVTVTLIDGLVLARSAFHHSFNYRSVMALGRTRLVSDPLEKDRALRAVVDHIAPGRSDVIRGGDRKELAATAVLAVPLDEVSAKVRTGPPKDEEDDYDLPIWAGVLPLAVVPRPPLPDERLDPSVPVPAHVAGWRRPAPAKDA